MKGLVHTLLILSLLLSKANSQSNDSNLINQTGWLIYMPDNNIIYVESKSTSVQKNHFFFQDTLYENGLIVTGYYDAEKLKEKAIKYKVYEWKNNEDPIQIRVLAVKAKISNESKSDPTTVEYRTFYRDNHEIQLSFRFLNTYRVVQFTPVNK